MRKLAQRIACVSLVALLLSAARADDSDIFLQSYVDPNVAILLDSSGSMDDPVNGGDGPSKMEIAKGALVDLVSRVSDVQFAIFRFHDDGNGAHLVSPVGTPTATLTTQINAMRSEGGTPLALATEDLGEYYRGEWPECTVGGSPAICPSPIQAYCQKSFAIVTSDGIPTRDDYLNQIVDVSRVLQRTDHSDLPGTQNVTVHVIGFDNDAGRQLMTRAATAGGGNFYEANSASELSAALLAALSSIVDDSYAFGAPRIPSTSFAGGDKSYIASFTPHVTRAFWNGSLKAYARSPGAPIPVDGDGKPDEAALAWDAGQALADRSAASRTIYTVIGGARAEFTVDNGNITPALLGVGTRDAADRVIQFVRGIDAYDADADGSSVEPRDWKLGDIYHSSPQLVYPPPLYAIDSAYNAFRTRHAQRPTIVLVGANDGMLHAFRESDGRELWAFIPPESLSQLHRVTAKAGDHPYFVDATPIVADVKLQGQWRTIAVFGMRRGGAGYHALDITDTADPQYLWSFYDADIRESWSEPAITRVKLADGSERWVAFVGGGYNTAHNNASGAAVLAIDLATGSALWKYSNTGLGDSRHMNFSIVATPAVVDTDGNGFPNYVYVGDVGGQLWKFNTAAAGTKTGGLIDNWPGMRLFAADPTRANPPPPGDYFPSQAMYGSPAVTLDEDGYRWIVVGTGDRSNPLRASANNFYAIKDTLGMAGGSTLTEADLVSARGTDTVTHGWFYPLAANEKVLSRADVFDGVVYFSTFTSESRSACEPAGSARVYAVKIDSGHAAVDWGDMSRLGDGTDGREIRSRDAGSGIPSAPQVAIQGGRASLVVGTTQKDISTDSFDAPPRKRLRYWRQLN